MAVASAAAPLPAAAQFSGSQPASSSSDRGPSWCSFAISFASRSEKIAIAALGISAHTIRTPPPRPVQPVEATKPPPPRKVETQPSSLVLVIGDTFADWLAFGLEQTLADTPDIGVVRKIRPSSGLVRYDVRPDSPDWSQAVKDMLATEKPSAIVVMLGVNDRLPLRARAPPSKTSPQGQQTEKAVRQRPAIKEPQMPRRRRMRRRPTVSSLPLMRPSRSAIRLPAITSFVPTSGPSFTKSASTT